MDRDIASTGGKGPVLIDEAVGVIDITAEMAAFGVPKAHIRPIIRIGDITNRRMVVEATFVQPIGMADDQCSAVCLLYTSPSPRDKRQSRMPSSA